MIVMFRMADLPLYGQKWNQFNLWLAHKYANYVHSIVYETLPLRGVVFFIYNILQFVFD